MKKANVAKGKTVDTVQDFAKVFSTLNVDQKTEVLKNIADRLKTKTNPDGSKMTAGAQITLAGLQSWCMVNLMVGEDLCPATSLPVYIKSHL